MLGQSITGTTSSYIPPVPIIKQNCPSITDILFAMLEQRNERCVMRDGKWKIVEVKCGTCLDGVKCEKRVENGHGSCEVWR